MYIILSQRETTEVFWSQRLQNKSCILKTILVVIIKIISRDIHCTSTVHATHGGDKDEGDILVTCEETAI